MALDTGDLIEQLNEAISDARFFQAEARAAQAQADKLRHALSLCIAVMDERDGRAWETAVAVFEETAPSRFEQEEQDD